MSVRGEFQRLLGDTCAFVEGSSSRDEAWSRALSEAGAIADETTSADALERSANAVLALRAEGASPPAPRFESNAEAEAFESLADHLCEICYAIVGRPTS